MIVDITLPVTEQMMADLHENDPHNKAGHVGTHFDTMGHEFPLNYLKCPGIVFDVSALRDAEITLTPQQLSLIQKGMFVAFSTGFINEHSYGTAPYLYEHPQLSWTLIDALLEKEIAFIGIDFAGVRRKKEHRDADLKCAARNCFIVENMYHLDLLAATGTTFTAHTYPVSFTYLTGLPSRVVAEFTDQEAI